MQRGDASRERRKGGGTVARLAGVAAKGRRVLTVVVAGLVLALAGLSIFALVAPLVMPEARAQAQPRAAQAPAGLFFESGVDGKVFEAPLLGSDVAITVNGEIARVSLVQHFHNPSEAWMEGAYVFPLPEDSAVDRLTMTVGEREIEGRIMEREEARRVYDAAAEAGQRASLLSSERANVFTTSVANVGPGETVSVRIEYQESLPYRDGRYSLRFPMVVAPRYTPGEAELVRAPAGNQDTPRPQPISAAGTAPGPEREDRDIFGPVRNPKDGKINPMRLSVEIDAGLPLAEVASLYHEVDIETAADGRSLVALREGAVAADRDFVLEWTPAIEGAPEAAVFGEQVGENSYLRIALLPQRDAGEVARPERDLIFIVDTSGSMYGPSMDQAKRALLTALDRLGPGDRFEIIRFANETQALFGGLRPAEQLPLNRAQRFVSSLEAEGGTEMLPALAAALKDPAEPGRLRQVVFLTDGAVGNEQQLFELIVDRLGGSRLFTVGIGSAPNSYFMTKAAEFGRGSFTYIGDPGEVAAHMERLFRKLERPALTGVQLTWEGPAAKRVEVVPAVMPDLYAGDPVAINARVAGLPLDSLHGSLLLTGEVGGQPWQRRLDLDEIEAAPGVAALWGRAQLEEIENGLALGMTQQTVRDLAVATALEFRLVSRYTSLVAVDDDVVRPEEDELRSGEVERNLPAGWSHEKVFGDAAAAMPLRTLPGPVLRQAGLAGSEAIALPQTATPAQLKMLVGLALLLLAAALLFAARGAARRPA